MFVQAISSSEQHSHINFNIVKELFTITRKSDRQQTIHNKSRANNFPQTFGNTKNHPRHNLLNIFLLYKKNMNFISVQVTDSLDDKLPNNIITIIIIIIKAIIIR